MYELTRRTADQFRYVLYEIELDARDPFHGADRSPLHDVVDEVQLTPARAGGTTQLARWTVTVPSILRAERRLATIINASRPDALVAHHQRFLQSPELLARVEAPTIYMLQEPRRRSFEYDLAHSGARPGVFGAIARVPIALLERWARRRDINATRASTRILCNSDHSREYVWRAYGRDADVIRLGVDHDHFSLAADPQKTNEVVSVGSLDSSKGHDLTVRAVGQVDAAIRPRLRIIHNRAEPTTAAMLRNLAIECGVDLVLETAISEDDLVTRYQSAHAVVLAGRVEPFGLTSIEAMACGTPAVAVREGGYRETVQDRRNGYLCDRSPESLAGGLTQVLKNELDSTPGEIRASVVGRFDWDAAAEVYAASIRSAIA
jgi:glycosyltransferase involved in cell wall biosynthesis